MHMFIKYIKYNSTKLTLKMYIKNEDTPLLTVSLAKRVDY